MEKNKSCSKAPPTGNLLKFITAGWATRIIISIYKGKMKPEEALWECPQSDSSKIASDRLELLWREEVQRNGIHEASLVKTLLRFDKSFLIAWLVGNVLLAMSVVAGNCWCFRAILSVVGTPVEDRSLAISVGCVVAFTIATAIQSVSQNSLRLLSDLLGCKLGTALMAFIYRKVLRLSDVNQDHVGKLLNIFSGDIYRFTRAVSYSQPLLSAAFIFPLTVIYISIYYGILAIAGSATFVFSCIVLFLGTKLLHRYKRKVAVSTSERLFATSELLNNIKFIKTQGCEQTAIRSVLRARKSELKDQFTMRIFESFLSQSHGFVLVFLQVFVISILILTQDDVTASMVFNVSAVFVALQSATRLISTGFRFGADIAIAVQHIEDILCKPEHTEPKPGNASETLKYAAVFSNAQFFLKDDVYDINTIEEIPETDVNPKSKLLTDNKTRIYSSLSNSKGEGKHATLLTSIPSIQNLNFSIEKGSLIGICGAIGTGKTLFLRSILGRLGVRSGSYQVNETIAYLPQTPWVINATLKDNILFGYPFDEQRYRSVLDVCCLRKDIMILPGGENTEIGERGVNLSGGQKQRVSLARSVYSNRELYLLDDPFSAVDNYVADRLFRRCVQEALMDKTVLLVTHRIKLMSQCDSVVFVKPGGQVVKSHHSDLMLNEDEYKQLLKSETSANNNQEGNDKDETVSDESEESDNDLSSSENGRLIIDDIQDTSVLKLSTVKSYLKATGGLWKFPLYLFFVFGFSCIQLLTSIWLRHWFVKDGKCYLNSTDVGRCNGTYREHYMDKDSPDFYLNLGLYIGTFEALIIVGLLQATVLAFMTTKAAQVIHIRFLERILSSPMRLFDVTPVGRLLNLFSSDLMAIDVGIGYDFDSMIIKLAPFLCIFSVIIYIAPWMAVMVIPCLIIVYYCTSRANSPIQIANKMEKAGRSIPYSLLSSAIHGIECVVAFDKTHQFINRFCQSLDALFVRTILPAAFVRWLAYRLDSINIMMACSLSIVLIFVDTTCTVADAGLALLLVIQISFIISNQPPHVKEVVGHFASVERLLNASKDIPSEKGSVTPMYEPGSDWPERGEVLIRDLWLRYQRHLPYILKGVNCHIQPGQKIGVVGRTGAGKSSLMTAFFRLVESSRGGIFVDGVDISTVPLRDLRYKLTMVSQDPILLSDTVRSNLVCNKDTNEEAIWQALDKCHLTKRIQSFPGQLDEVMSGGGNLSVGEKQLICMARAMLNNSKVMLLDEATASMDPYTDYLLQRTIRSCFSECTMLIIAHRLNTVLDCDKILVMEDGQSVEFDTPANLLADPNSRLSMMKQSRNG